MSTILKSVDPLFPLIGAALKKFEGRKIDQDLAKEIGVTVNAVTSQYLISIVDMYAVGSFTDGKMGFTDGPTPHMKNLVDRAGNSGDYVVKLSKDNTDESNPGEPIFYWDDATTKWQLIGE